MTKLAINKLKQQVSSDLNYMQKGLGIGGNRRAS